MPSGRLVGLAWRLSLSSWRAWIEIKLSGIIQINPRGRSPHGERGLKSDPAESRTRQAQVALLMESVD